MALIESSMLPLGTIAPDFELKNTIDDTTIKLSQLQIQRGLVIAFICNHCPYVIHVNRRFVEVAKEYQKKGITFIAISSNSIVSHPQDGPEYMKKKAQELDYPFPYLFDDKQDVARAYRAECTPDFYLFDENRALIYRGRFDETRPGGQEATGIDLTTAIENQLNSRGLVQDQYPSIGCNIKWH